MSGTESPSRTDELDWRRLHPVTPLLRGWSVIAILLVILGQRTMEGLPEGDTLLADGRWWQVLLPVLGIGVIGLGYSALAWRKTTYAIDTESVRLHQGILFKSQRNARLDRLQAVDVVQPLLARFFGLAELKLEVAGGSGSAIKLGFLKEDEANRLRRELLARAAGLRLARAQGVTPTVEASGAPTSEAAGPARTGHPVQPLADRSAQAQAQDLLPFDAAPEAPEQPVQEVPVGRLVGSLVLSGPLVGLAVSVLAMIGVAIGTRQPGILFPAIPALLGFGGQLFNRFSGEFGFRSAISPDGIRLRHGLLESRSQTIPPGRVQAIKLSQPVLWRLRDWWRVEVNVAGYGTDEDGTQNTNTLLPVGSREDVLTAVWLVLPDLGAGDPRLVLGEGLTGTKAAAGFTTAPRRVAWLDPIAWPRIGFAATERALLLRSGRLWRHLVIVPHERTQSLGLAQGPWQRRFRVATFAVHSTPGPISPTVAHLDQDDAAALLDAQAARASQARAQEGPELWMRRDEVPR